MSTKTIEQIKGMTIARAKLGSRSGVSGSVRQEVHDGDTITVRTSGNFGVRFLATDAPEISFQLPGKMNFTGIGDPRWEVFFRDPFDPAFGEFKEPLEPGLLRNLRSRMGSGIARNHYEHAVAAEQSLEEMVQADMEELGQNEETFQFFLVFANDVVDRYGRFLCFINREQPEESTNLPRPISYNERMLQAGKACPYFIWPNLNPFRRQPTLAQAVIKPGKVIETVHKEKSLRVAREWVTQARQQKVGIFDAGNPLRIQPFEIRFLSRRMPPDRWVIDMSSDDNLLIRPQGYYRIKNAEDRLFIPPEYVPLFVEAGWHRQPRPHRPTD